MDNNSTPAPLTDDALTTSAPPPSFFDLLRDLFLRPFGRNYPGRYWGGMQPRRDRFGARMMRIKEEDGDHFFASDDAEYVQPKARRYRAEIIDKGEPRVVPVPIAEPWHRVTPKMQRPGAERRARLRADRVSP